MTDERTTGITNGTMRHQLSATRGLLKLAVERIQELEGIDERRGWDAMRVDRNRWQADAETMAADLKRCMAERIAAINAHAANDDEQIANMVNMVDRLRLQNKGAYTDRDKWLGNFEAAKQSNERLSRDVVIARSDAETLAADLHRCMAERIEYLERWRKEEKQTADMANRLREQNKGAYDARDVAIGALKSVQRDRDLVVKQRNAHAAACDELHASLDRCRTHADALTSEKVALRAERDDAAKQFTDMRDMRDDLSFRVIEAANERDAFKKSAYGLESTVSAMNTERDGLLTSCKLADKRNGDDRRALATAIADRDAYRDELESALEHSDRMSGADTSDYIALKRERDVLADRVDVSQSEFKRMVGLKNDMMVERDRLFDTCNANDAQFAKLIGERDAANERACDRDDVVEELTTKVALMDVLNTEQIDIITSLRVELEKATILRNAYGEELDTAHDQQAGLTKRFGEVLTARKAAWAAAKHFECERNDALTDAKTYRDAAELFERERDQARQGLDINKSYADECRTLRGKIQDQRARYFKLCDMLKQVDIDVIAQEGEPVAIVLFGMDGDNDGE